MDDKNFDNIIALIKLFEDKPYLLGKYLLDNNAFSKSFLNKLNKSDIRDIHSNFNFKCINEIEDFLSNLLESSKSKDLAKTLNSELTKALEDEDYLRAANLKAYMEKKSIKISK